MAEGRMRGAVAFSEVVCKTRSATSPLTLALSLMERGLKSKPQYTSDSHHPSPSREKVADRPDEGETIYSVSSSSRNFFKRLLSAGRDIPSIVAIMVWFPWVRCIASINN